MKSHFLYLALLIILAILAGVSLQIAVIVYKKYTHLVYNTVTSMAAEREPFLRFGTITALNPTTADVTLLIRNIVTGVETEVRAKVTSDTKLVSQNPIIEDGAVVGFEKEKPMTPEQLYVGARVQARFAVHSSGYLILQRLSIGSPFPRF